MAIMGRGGGKGGDWTRTFNSKRHAGGAVRGGGVVRGRGVVSGGGVRVGRRVK